MYNVIKATKADKKRIQRFYHQQHYSASFVGYDECYIIEEECFELEGIEHHNKIIAAAIVSMSHHTNQQPWLHGLVVNAHHQRQGIASVLMRHITACYTELVCFASPELIPFYQPLGFYPIEQMLNNTTFKLNSPCKMSLGALSETNLNRYQNYLTSQRSLIALHFQSLKL